MYELSNEDLNRGIIDIEVEDTIFQGIEYDIGQFREQLAKNCQPIMNHFTSEHQNSDRYVRFGTAKKSVSVPREI